MFYVGQAVARAMIPRGQGKIVNIASVQSELARPGIAPYTATKGAVGNLTRGMCDRLGQARTPGQRAGARLFRTPLNQALVDDPEFSAWLEGRTPAGRWGEVEELVGAAVFLPPRVLLRQRPHRSTSTAASPRACEGAMEGTGCREKQSYSSVSDLRDEMLAGAVSPYFTFFFIKSYFELYFTRRCQSACAPAPGLPRRFYLT